MSTPLIYEFILPCVLNINKLFVFDMSRHQHINWTHSYIATFTIEKTILFFLFKIQIAWTVNFTNCFILQKKLPHINLYGFNYCNFKFKKFANHALGHCWWEEHTLECVFSLSLIKRQKRDRLCFPWNILTVIPVPEYHRLDTSHGL